MYVPNIHGGLEGVRILGTTVISYESPCGPGNWTQDMMFFFFLKFFKIYMELENTIVCE